MSSFSSMSLAIAQCKGQEISMTRGARCTMEPSRSSDITKFSSERQAVFHKPTGHKAKM